MTSDDVEALSEEALRREFVARGIDFNLYPDKDALGDYMPKGSH